MNPIFDTRVQELKYKVLKEIDKYYFNGTLLEDYNYIPTKIVIHIPIKALITSILAHNSIHFIISPLFLSQL